MNDALDPDPDKANQTQQDDHSSRAEFELSNPSGPPELSVPQHVGNGIAYPRSRRKLLPAILFVLTCMSTFWVGVALWSPTAPFEGLQQAPPQIAVGLSMMDVRQITLKNWDIGLTYMFAVILIIFLHEMGHFIATLYYRVPASFPFFIPFPINPIGTMGAVIAMHGLTADRKQIFDIGIAGPLAGLVAAVPIAYIGTAQLDLTTQPMGGIGFRLPLIMEWFATSTGVPGYQPGDAVWMNQLNPMFVAGWVGMLITGLNMMPIGQLDGGHVTYTLFGRTAHLIARCGIVFAIAFMVYHQNFMLVLMVVLLLLVGTDHPPTRDDRVRLGWFRWALGIASLSIPVLCFPPLVFKLAG